MQWQHLQLDGPLPSNCDNGPTTATADIGLYIK